MNQPTAVPTRKVTAATLGAAVAQLLGAVFGWDTEITFPLTTILTFVAGYMVPDKG